MTRKVSKDKKLRPSLTAPAKSAAKKDAKPTHPDKSAKPAKPPGAGAKPTAAKNGKSVPTGKNVVKVPKEAEKGKKDGAKPAGAKSATEGAKGSKTKDATPAKKDAAAKPKDAPPKRKRKSSVVRLKAYWGVFNQMLKRVAVFEYAERKQADKKASELSTSAKQPHFVQLVKEVIRDED
jgi:hypothetical protein